MAKIKIGSNEKHPRVVLVKSKAKKAIDPFRLEQLARREWLYQVGEHDGMVRISPYDTAASYMATDVPADCVRPYRKPGNTSGGAGK